jgi:phosphate transport system substrate-binding protein
MANQKKVKALSIDSGKGPIEPTDENVAKGNYPLARQLYIYVNAQAAAKPQVDAFVSYFLESVKRLATETGYLPLTDENYRLANERYSKKVLGSVSAKNKPSKS